ncbi:hypothetical protein ACFCWG_29820, partial [Streptomyces sp. NPDC056390]|uniref:hypothetical protein n=1 Tax=Streptomyces sp. NPDC056390 TaxID=3345806 RepID=UPI0035DB4F92
MVDSTTNTWTPMGGWTASSPADSLKPISFVEYYKSVDDWASIPGRQAMRSGCAVRIPLLRASVALSIPGIAARKVRLITK